jgi:hypothetical protein
MTIDRVAMKELLEKGSDQDLLREMLAFVAARMMDVEVESLTGAGRGTASVRSGITGISTGTKRELKSHAVVEIWVAKEPTAARTVAFASIAGAHRCGNQSWMKRARSRGSHHLLAGCRRQGSASRLC